VGLRFKGAFVVSVTISLKAHWKTNETMANFYFKLLYYVLQLENIWPTFSSLTRIIIHSKYFPNSDWLNAHA